MSIKGDIDIDFANREEILSLIPYVAAARYERGELKKHNSGIYLQKIPVNPITNVASIDYETAEKRGYYKLDFLPQIEAPKNMYNTFRGYKGTKKELFDVDIENSKLMKHIRNIFNNDNKCVEFHLNQLVASMI